MGDVNIGELIKNVGVAIDELMRPETPDEVRDRKAQRKDVKHLRDNRSDGFLKVVLDEFKKLGRVKNFSEKVSKNVYDELFKKEMKRFQNPDFWRESPERVLVVSGGFIGIVLDKMPKPTGGFPSMLSRLQSAPPLTREESIGNVPYLMRYTVLKTFIASAAKPVLRGLEFFLTGRKKFRRTDVLPDQVMDSCWVMICEAIAFMQYQGSPVIWGDGDGDDEKSGRFLKILWTVVLYPPMVKKCQFVKGTSEALQETTNRTLLLQYAPLWSSENTSGHLLSQPSFTEPLKKLLWTDSVEMKPFRDGTFSVRDRVGGVAANLLGRLLLQAMLNQNPQANARPRGVPSLAAQLRAFSESFKSNKPCFPTSLRVFHDLLRLIEMRTSLVPLLKSVERLLGRQLGETVDTLWVELLLRVLSTDMMMMKDFRFDMSELARVATSRLSKSKLDEIVDRLFRQAQGSTKDCERPFKLFCVITSFGYDYDKLPQLSTLLELACRFSGVGDEEPDSFLDVIRMNYLTGKLASSTDVLQNVKTLLVAIASQKPQATVELFLESLEVAERHSGGSLYALVSSMDEDKESDALLKSVETVLRWTRANVSEKQDVLVGIARLLSAFAESTTGKWAPSKVSEVLVSFVLPISEDREDENLEVENLEDSVRSQLTLAALRLMCRESNAKLLKVVLLEQGIVDLLLQASWDKKDLIRLIDVLRNDSEKSVTEFVQMILEHCASPGLASRRTEDQVAFLEGEMSEHSRVSGVVKNSLATLTGPLLKTLSSNDTTQRPFAARVLRTSLDLDPKQYGILCKEFGIFHDAAEQVNEAALATPVVSDKRALSFLAEPQGSSVTRTFQNDSFFPVTTPKDAARLAKSLRKWAKKKSHGGDWLDEDGEEDCALGESTSCMVETPTTLSNIRKVQRLAQSRAPILLEGDTGVGKSATIAEAAARSGTTLLRFNMSRSITPDDLLLQIRLGSHNQICSSEQPFTVAFRDGNWLLLDEINLAEEQVIQCIQEAIDSGVLSFKDPSNLENHHRVIRRHENFRLFATQNPNSGFFKGKREAMSGSLLSRFIPLAISPLPPQEMKQIIAFKLAQDLEVDSRRKVERHADLLVDFHMSLQNLVATSQFTERREYSSFSIREMLRVTGHSRGDLEKLQETPGAVVSQHAWRVYVLRFRDESVYEQVWKNSFPEDWKSSCESWKVFEAGQGYCVSGNPVDMGKVEVKLPYPTDEHWFAGMSMAHNRAVSHLHSMEVMEKYGLYLGTGKLWGKWVEHVANLSQEFGVSTVRIGAKLYAGHVRHESLKQELVRIIHQAFGGIKYEEVTNPDEWWTSWEEDVVPRAPIAITPRVKRILSLASRSLQSQVPVLLVGDVGCGKTSLVMALAELWGSECVRAYLTPEVETQLLVGSQRPSGKPDGPQVVWQDGLVTKAVKEGTWILLDNINDADPCVLERLNPLLEEKVDWRLNERGPDKDGSFASLNVPDSFRTVATMCGTATSRSSCELSPALFNRFETIYVPRVDDTELATLISTILCVDPSSKEMGGVIESCRGWFQNKGTSLRQLVRLLDGGYRIRRQFPRFNGDAFRVATLALSANQQVPSRESWPEEVEFKQDSKLVLAGNRKSLAKKTNMAQLCGNPILLEGPPAVGKTAMISELARHRDPVKKLYRVNNTETTTIQDYFGMFLPSSTGLSFQPGPLSQAIKNGDWFLADELNLAEPSIMSYLAPLLEGTASFSVPESNRVLDVHPEFRFFATQNPSGREFAGRNPLPKTLRSRFVEIEVKDYNGDELCQILEKRQDRPSGVDDEKQIFPPLPVEVRILMANAYTMLQSSKDLRVTFRELVKWRRRFHMVFPNNRLNDLDCWRQTGMSLLVSRVRNAEQSTKLAEALGLRPLSRNSAELDRPTQIWQCGNSVCVEYGGLSKVVTIENASLSLSDLLRRHLDKHGRLGGLPMSFTKCLAEVLIAAKNREPILLVGPTSFKSTIYKVWADINKLPEEDKIVCYLSPDTEAAELIGQIQPYSVLSGLEKIQTGLWDVYRRISSETSRGLDETREALNQFTTTIMKFRLQQQALLEQERIVRDEENADWDIGLDNEQENWSDDFDFVGESDVPTSASETSSIAFIESDQCEAHEYDEFSSSETSSIVFIESGQGERQEEYDENDSSNTPAPNTGNPDEDTLPNPFASIKSEDADARFRNPDQLENDEDTLPNPFASIENEDADARFRNPDQLENDEDTLPNPFASIENEDADADVRNADQLKNDEECSLPDPFLSATGDNSSECTGSGGDRGIAASYDSRDDVLDTSLSDKVTTDDEANWDSDSNHSGGQYDSEMEAEASSGLAMTLEDHARLARATFDGNHSWQEFQDCAEAAMNVLKLLPDLSFDMNEDTRSTVKQSLDQMEDLLKDLQRIVEKGSTNPIFAFKEGSVTRAVVRGAGLLLEDFDLPNPSVTERLNSILEPDPEFILLEDIKRAEGEGGQRVVVSPAFQVFATVHQQLGQQFHVSPATRSRFTEIVVPSLVVEDVQGNSDFRIIVADCVKDINGTEATKGMITNALLEVMRVWSQSRAGKKSTPTQLLRVVKFLVEESNQGNTDTLKELTIVGVRFLLIGTATGDVLSNVKHALKVELDLQEDEVNDLFNPPSKDAIAVPFEESEEMVRCRYGIVSLKVNPEGQGDAPALERFKLHPTKTAIQNVARILTAVSARCPLLLEGPPGIGKTAIVEAVARLGGYKVKRINLSANTTLDQLVGSIVPRVVGGKRVFDWQDGSLVTAIREKEWVLLDEINLAPPDVLEAVAPYLTGVAPLLKDAPDVHIFGTMNPVSVGGGRTKLPRSIESLFSVVRLQAYEKEELWEIVKSVYQELVPSDGDEGGILSLDHLESIFLLHNGISELVDRKEIGKGLSECKFNLRDLVKLRDLLQSNAENIESYLRFNEVIEEGDDGATDARVLVIRRFASLVYIECLHDAQERKKAEAILDKHFTPNPSLMLSMSRDVEISGSMIRIGAAHLHQGEFDGNMVPLIHTDETLIHLEALAMTVLSRCPILLEGAACSGKSSLVKELARLCKRKLVVISLTDNTEASDLVGQWVCKQENSGIAGGHKPEILARARSRAKLLVGRLLPVIVEANDRVRSERSRLNNAKDRLEKIHEQVIHTISLSLSEPGRDIPDVDLGEMLSCQVHCLDSCADLFDNLLDSRLGRTWTKRICGIFEMVKRLREMCMEDNTMLRESKEVEVDGKPGAVTLSFDFMESELVKAMRNGDWVLLDNVNSAPPVVLERLNSLFEGSPTFALLEKGSGEFFSTEDGQGSNFHKDFRVFSTADMGRKNSYKLSSAFLNRVIRMWLPALDADCSVAGTTYCVVSNLLPKPLYEGHLANFLTEFHERYRRQVDVGSIHLIGGVRVTFNMILRTVKTAEFLLSGEMSRGDPLEHYLRSVWFNYVDCVESDCRQNVVTLLAEVLQKEELWSSSLPSGVLRRAIRGQKETWHSDYSSLQRIGRTAESLLLEAAHRLVKSLTGHALEEVKARLIDHFIPKMNPQKFLNTSLSELPPDEIISTLRVVQDMSTDIPTLSKLLKGAFEKVYLGVWEFVGNAAFTRSDTKRRVEALRRLSDMGSLFNDLFLNISEDVLKANQLEELFRSTNALAKLLLGVSNDRNSDSAIHWLSSVPMNNSVEQMLASVAEQLDQPGFATDKLTFSGLLAQPITRSASLLRQQLLQLRMDLTNPPELLSNIEASLTYAGAVWKAIFPPGIPLHLRFAFQSQQGGVETLDLDRVLYGLRQMGVLLVAEAITGKVVEDASIVENLSRARNEYQSVLEKEKVVAECEEEKKKLEGKLGRQQDELLAASRASPGLVEGEERASDEEGETPPSSPKSPREKFLEGDVRDLADQVKKFNSDLESKRQSLVKRESCFGTIVENISLHARDLVTKDPWWDQLRHLRGFLAFNDCRNLIHHWSKLNPKTKELIRRDSTVSHDFDLTKLVEKVPLDTVESSWGSLVAMIMLHSPSESFVEYDEVWLLSDCNVRFGLLSRVKSEVVWWRTWAKSLLQSNGPSAKLLVGYDISSRESQEFAIVFWIQANGLIGARLVFDGENDSCVDFVNDLCREDPCFSTQEAREFHFDEGGLLRTLANSKLQRKADGTWLLCSSMHDQCRIVTSLDKSRGELTVNSDKLRQRIAYAMRPLESLVETVRLTDDRKKFEELNNLLEHDFKKSRASRLHGLVEEIERMVRRLRPVDQALLADTIDSTDLAGDFVSEVLRHDKIKETLSEFLRNSEFRDEVVAKYVFEDFHNRVKEVLALVDGGGEGPVAVEESHQIASALSSICTNVVEGSSLSRNGPSLGWDIADFETKVGSLLTTNSLRSSFTRTREFLERYKSNAPLSNRHSRSSSLDSGPEPSVQMEIVEEQKRLTALLQKVLESFEWGEEYKNQMEDLRKELERATKKADLSLLEERIHRVQTELKYREEEALANDEFYSMLPRRLRNASNLMQFAYTESTRNRNVMQTKHQSLSRPLRNALRAQKVKNSLRGLVQNYRKGSTPDQVEKCIRGILRCRDDLLRSIDEADELLFQLPPLSEQRRPLAALHFIRESGIFKEFDEIQRFWTIGNSVGSLLESSQPDSCRPSFTREVPLSILDLAKVFDNPGLTKLLLDAYVASDEALKGFAQDDYFDDAGFQTEMSEIEEQIRKDHPFNGAILDGVIHLLRDTVRVAGRKVQSLEDWIPFEIALALNTLAEAGHTQKDLECVVGTQRFVLDEYSKCSYETIRPFLKRTERESNHRNDNLLKRTTERVSRLCEILKRVPTKAFQEGEEAERRRVVSLKKLAVDLYESLQPFMDAARDVNAERLSSSELKRLWEDLKEKLGNLHEWSDMNATLHGRCQRCQC